MIDDEIGPSKSAVSGRTTVSDYAEHTLREMVLQGQFEAGSRLNEVSIAEQLGISRGPLREAIQRLASEGLLRQVRHRGAFVMSLTGAELRELYELRIAIESFSVRRLCHTCDDAAKSQLQVLLEQTEQVLSQQEAYPATLDFHRTLVSLTGNTSLSRAARDVEGRLRLARARSAHQSERARVALHEHRLIVESICAGDDTRASELMEDHLWSSYENAAVLLTTNES